MNCETRNMAWTELCGIDIIHKMGGSWRREGNKIKDSGRNLHFKGAIFLH